MIALNRAGVNRIWPFAVLAPVLWYCVLHSGVHATIAGVVAALTIPMIGKNDDTLLERTEHTLAPWNAYLWCRCSVSPTQASIWPASASTACLAPLPLAIGAGLMVGKQLGIFSAIVVADRIGFAPRPANAVGQRSGD